MPQLILPVFSSGVTSITPELGVAKDDGRVTYFHGLLPVFSHDEDDVRSFHMITSQFCCNGSAREVDIVRAFGVTSTSVKRNVKRFREHGTGAFFAKRKSRGAAVLTAPVLAEAQQLLDAGMDVPDVAEKLVVKRNTLAKAVRAGRLHEVKKKTSRTS